MPVPVPVRAAAEFTIAPTGAASAAQGQRRSNYFVRHWRGELPLPVSYWVNGSLVGVASVAFIAMVGIFEQTTLTPLRLAATTGLVMLTGSGLCSVWSVVGIWRAAGHHASRGGSKGWAIAARVVIVCSTLGTIAPLTKNVLPQMREFGLIAIGRDPIGSYRVNVSPDGRSVRVVGTFREGSAARIVDALDATPTARWLVLDSNGGRLLEAERLARDVRARGLNTYVGRLCASACTFVFLAGKTRAASPDARIGFHQPSGVGLNSLGQRQITQSVLDRYRSAGLPPELIRRVAQTPPNKIWFPTVDELVRARVVTVLGTPAGIAPS